MQQTQSARTRQFNVIGTRPIRHDGYDKVTGRAKFGADVNLPGTLHGKLLRSPHAHARIRSIDASRALELLGVHAVVTAQDMPEVSAEVRDQAEGVMVNYGFYTRNVMAREKVLYVGHVVAAVAATSPAIAEEALGLIDVDYEVLPAVLDAASALADGAPAVHERLQTMDSASRRAGGWGDIGETTNLANRFEFRAGDLEAGFREADVVVEESFSTEFVHQGYIEPHATTALWAGDGNVTVYASCQGSFPFRDHLATMLDLPMSKIKVIPTEIGGGFGGKGMGGVYLEPTAAFLSKKSGRPVKIVMSRSDVFLGTGPASGTNISVKLGATRDGRITAAEAHLVYEAGAFPGSPVGSGCRTMFAPYVISNALIEGVDVVVNKQKSGAYRAPGSPAAAFASEQAMDLLALKLGIDPIELRLFNASKEGTHQVGGPAFLRIGNVETLETARDHAHSQTTLDGAYQGRGVASGAWFNGTGPASAIASVNPDGTVSLTEGTPDLAGARVVMAMHVAEVLGIEATDVKPAVGDTDSIGYSSGAGGSSLTHKMGTACFQAAEDVKRQMIERAARIWEVDEDDIEYEGGELKHKQDSELSMTFKELAQRLNGTGGPVVGRATVNPGGVGNAFACHVIDVEVDPATGKVQVLRYTAVQDVGTAIHPSNVEGQMQGGAVQGIGWALNEEYFFDNDGRMLNSSFLDYRIPTTLDLPMIEAVLVEVPNPGHPFGARGVGEVALVPPLAAVANAVSNAIGVRMTELPLTPAKIRAAIASKES